MNPYIRDVICTYYAAQTLVSMMVPGFDEVAKVRVFAAGEENGQVVYVPDEVSQSGASGVKRKAWYEAKIAVLVAGQMAERYLYGPDKVSQFGNLDMREATALACEMVMMHGWSDIGPICVLRADSTEEKYLKGGVNKGNQTAGMDSGRTRGKLWGIPPGKDGTLAEGRKAWIQLVRGTVSVNGQTLEAGDGLGLDTAGALSITAQEDAELLLFDLAAQGHVTAIDAFLDYDSLNSTLIPGFLDSARYQGRVYGATTGRCPSGHGQKKEY